MEEIPIFCVECPSCGDLIEIKEIKCAIFRHGVFKDTLESIDPHSSKKLCDELVYRNFIFGCGKPFRIIIEVENNEAKYKAIKCDYI